MVDDLLEATARVLIREGWDKASTNRIARAAGVSVGSVYQYFPNKEALVLALATRHANQMVGMFVGAAADLAGAPIEHAIPVFVRMMFDAHRVEPELHIALVHQLLHVGLEPVEEIQRASKALVSRYLEAHRDRLIPQDLDAAAWMCVTTVEAIVHAAVLDRGVDRLGDPAIERELSAMLIRYLIGSTAGAPNAT
ncbi:MAG: TetR/AcrR family transcriptional regulator [Myxococcota bacterium]